MDWETVNWQAVSALAGILGSAGTIAGLYTLLFLRHRAVS